MKSLYFYAFNLVLALAFVQDLRAYCPATPDGGRSSQSVRRMFYGSNSLPLTTYFYPDEQCRDFQVQSVSFLISAPRGQGLVSLVINDQVMDHVVIGQYPATYVLKAGANVAGARHELRHTALALEGDLYLENLTVVLNGGYPYEPQSFEP